MNLNRKNALAFLLLFVFPFHFTFGQALEGTANNDDVIITPLPFNSPETDFGVAVVDNGVIFTSNRSDEGIFRTEGETTPFDIYFVEKNGDGFESWGTPRPIKGSVNTKVVDAFPTTTTDHKTIFFARNIVFEGSLGDINRKDNKVGLFQAKLIDGQWQEVKPLPFNSKEYNLFHPTVGPDGKVLYFTSDMEGGQGGMDIYTSRLENGQWTSPENLGKTVNSSGNDNFPYLHPDGTLYFSSNGHDGFGGMDIFRTYKSEEEGWAIPVNIGAPVNDASNQVGYLTDVNHQFGYYCSDKDGDLNIYGVEMLSPVFIGCTYALKNNHCYSFFEEGTTSNDSIPAMYQWDFGDGNSAMGLEVEYCYTTEGNFEVTLNVIDSITGEIYAREASYRLPIKDHEQVYITASTDTVEVGQEISFDGSRTKYSGVELKNYYWDFADGIRKKGVKVSHKFAIAGTYKVQLGITGSKGGASGLTKYCGIKKIVVTGGKNDQGGKNPDKKNNNKKGKKPKKKKGKKNRN